MTKLTLVLLLFLIGIAIPLVHSTNEVDEWIQKLHHAKEKVSRLHFYFHDTLSGKNPSAVEVAEASKTKKSPSFLVVAMNFVFTTGKFNGSSLTILGRNATLQPLREMPIIGGTGAFRLARGFVTAKTYFLNFTSGDAIVQYHVVAIHY
ncbi:hypothetical protein ACB092_07G175600 [Castanea dentata]